MHTQPARHRSARFASALVLVAALLTALGIETEPAQAKSGPTKVTGRAIGTYATSDGNVHGIANYFAKVGRKDGRPILRWKLRAAENLYITRWEIARKAKPKQVIFYSDQSGRGTLKGSVSTYTKSLYKKFERFAQSPGKYVLRVRVLPDDSIDGFLTLTGKVQGGKVATISPKQVKTKHPTYPASTRFRSLRAKLETGGQKRLDRLVAVMTDRQTEWIEGQSLVCWMAGGGMGGLLTAQSRLRGEAAEMINNYLRQVEFNEALGYSPCDSLLIASLGYLANVHDIKRTGAPRTAAKGSSCRVAGVAVYLDGNTVRLSQEPHYPPFRLDFPTCVLKKKNTRMIIKAQTRGESQALSEVGPRIHLSMADRRAPRSKPKVKVSMKQYGEVE